MTPADLHALARWAADRDDIVLSALVGRALQGEAEALRVCEAHKTEMAPDLPEWGAGRGPDGQPVRDG